MYISMFEGPVLGNMETCQLQAFLMMLGLCASSAFYPCLSVYYALTIAFHVQDETIRKYIEPFFYIVDLGKGLPRTRKNTSLEKFTIVMRKMKKMKSIIKHWKAQ